MKKVIKKTKKVTTNDLAIMVTRGFDKIEKDMVEIKENNKNIRKDIFNLGDRFPSQFAFDQLSRRVYNLEKKVISKR